jgi:hypothetical protein
MTPTRCAIAAAAAATAYMLWRLHIGGSAEGYTDADIVLRLRAFADGLAGSSAGPGPGGEEGDADDLDVVEMDRDVSSTFERLRWRNPRALERILDHSRSDSAHDFQRLRAALATL